MSAFQVGHTYKFNGALIQGMNTLMKTVYSGEEGVFTVAEIEESTGAVFTDDITSPTTKQRCKIPAHIIHDCEEVADASRATT